MNKHLERIKILTLNNLIDWKFIDDSLIKYSKKIRGEGIGLVFVIRKSIKNTYVCFKKKDVWITINADIKDIIELYNFVRDRIIKDNERDIDNMKALKHVVRISNSYLDDLISEEDEYSVSIVKKIFV
jgi:hypothetical protein